MQQIKKILCATDLSGSKDELLSFVTGLGVQFGASLLVFHAIPPPRGSVARQIEFERGGEKQEQMDRAQRQIETAMAGFDIKWESHITYGDPVLEAARVAKETAPDIVIAASHGLSVFQQFLIGSVIGDMAQTVLCPLLVIPPGKTVSDAGDPELKFTHITMACALKKSDAHLKEYAMIFSQRFASKISLVHVMESPVNEAVMAGTLGHYDETQHRLEENLYLQLNRLMPGNAHILHGVPGEALALYAKKHGTDLIIAGIDHRPGRITPTTTSTLLRQMPCALLIIPINR